LSIPETEPHAIAAADPLAPLEDIDLYAPQFGPQQASPIIRSSFLTKSREREATGVLTSRLIMALGIALLSVLVIGIVTVFFLVGSDDRPTAATTTITTAGPGKPAGVSDVGAVASPPTGDDAGKEVEASTSVAGSFRQGERDVETATPTPVVSFPPPASEIEALEEFDAALLGNLMKTMRKSDVKSTVEANRRGSRVNYRDTQLFSDEASGLTVLSESSRETAFLPSELAGRPAVKVANAGSQSRLQFERNAPPRYLGEIVDGQRSGVWLKYHENGRLRVRSQYSADLAAS
jgi:hypothetical protein